MDDPLKIEGLAAQLYSNGASKNREHFVWWHLLREDIKQEWRKEAVMQIAKFRAATPF